MSILTSQPAWLVGLCLLSGLLVSALLYFRNPADEFTPWMKWLLASLRFLAFSVLAFLLLSPLVKSIKTTKEKPLIIMALDNSLSVTQGSGGSSAASGLLQEWNALTSDLADKYEVRNFLFGDKIGEGTEATFDEKYTDLSLLQGELETRFANRNVGAMVLATDGLMNRGGNPLYDRSTASYPIYGVALGDTSRQRDALISRLYYNRISYLGNEFPVEIVVQASEYEGEQLNLSVFRQGQWLRRVPVRVTSADFSTTLSLAFPAEEAGVFEYSFRLESMEGEVNLENNRQAAFIEILDSRQKVLILAEAPHPDITAIRQAIEGNENYEVEARVIGQAAIDPQAYNLVILHQLPSREHRNHPVFESIRKARLPYLSVIGGSSDLQAFNTLNPPVLINNAKTGTNEAQAILANSFSLFTLPDGLESSLREYPPLKVPFAEFRPTRSASTLFQQKIGSVTTNYPLIVFNQDPEWRNAAVLGEGLWKWRIRSYMLRGDHRPFDELIQKMVQYLSIRDDRSRFRVVAEYEYAENTEVVLDAEFYNQSYELVNEPDVRLKLEDDSGNVFDFTFSRKGPAYSLNCGILPSGRYSYTAVTQWSGETFTRSGAFTVTPVVVEMLATKADHSLLYSLAERSDGKVTYPGAMDQISEWLGQREDIRTLVYEKKAYMELIHFKWIFTVVLLWLSLEWFLRRYLGSY